jgi:hypothetical protein
MVMARWTEESGRNMPLERFWCEMYHMRPTMSAETMKLRQRDRLNPAVPTGTMAAGA